MDVVVLHENNVVIKERELALVTNISKDMTISEAAANANINQRTAEGMVLRLRTKFGCKSLGGLVGVFFRNNLIQ